MDNEKKPMKKRIDKLFDEIPYEEPDTEPRKDDNEPVGQKEVDSEEPRSQEAESTSGENEPDVSGMSREDDESIQSDLPDVESEEEMSADDLLEDVRRSLITETAEQEKVEETKWWKRIGKRSRKKKEDVGAPTPEPVEPVSMQDDAEPVVNVDGQEDEYVEQLDELIDMLEDDVETEPETNLLEEESPVIEVDEPAPVKEPEVVNFKELKERAFHSRTTPEEEERALSEVRTIALDDGEEVFIEVEAKPEDARQDRVKAIENALKPYRRYFYFVFIFVSLIMVALVSVSLFRLYQRSLPPPPTEEPALLPYPVGMNLPGGLRFSLGKGKLQEGKWNPRGPEWLEGTEVCRWIAIPHSRQLEAVVRTLTREDQIELVMSNNDTLTYTVSSIDQLTLDEMQARDTSSPCMLLVLAQADTEERWVVTAIP